MLQKKLTRPSPTCTDLKYNFSIEDIVYESGTFAIDLIMNVDETTAPPHITQNTDVYLSATCTSDYVGFSESVTNALSSRLSLDSYCHLSMAGDCGDVSDQSSILHDFLHGVPLLKVLQVKPDHSYTFDNDMPYKTSARPFPNVLAASDEAEDNFLLPNLHELHVNLKDDDDDYRNDIDEEYCADKWKTLYNLFTDLTTTLGSRKERGSRLSTLTIHASHFILDTGNHPDNTLDRFVTQLQDVVGKVVVVRPREIPGRRKVGHRTVT